MGEKRTCPSCGAEMPSDAPAGLCVACLLAVGLPAKEAPTRLAEPGKTITVALSLTEKAGDRIGRYKLLQQIGEGGCGVVYMAEQAEPVRRRVALKVIKLGMDTKEVVARFEAERQALALMDHPNIAKVLDAGATENGRPFFVMELVKGIPITRYCDESQLDTRQRLDLFIQVCQAIQHAHQKGIIHRDIKPTNILVADHDGVPVPKVIDFGIAKATAGQTLTDKTVFTAFEQFIGTPAYMSPEQAKLSGLDIDTRSDIYSLGVLLYELLTGKTPFDAKRLVEAGFDEIRRIIREEDPPRPSTKLSTLDAKEQTDLARRRHSEPPKLLGLIRGDLDWIVMRTLEKDRNRRYETANGLAMDLKRFLTHEPVVARPPSNIYRLKKLVRRHSLAVAALGAIAASLLAGLGISTRFYLNERTERHRAQESQRNAERQAKIAKATTDFLTGMFDGIDPAVAKLREITVREVLDEAGRTIADAFPNEPLTELPIRHSMIDIYNKLGQGDLALPQAEAALRLARAAHGEKDHADVAQSLDDVALCESNVGHGAGALAKYEVALAMYSRMHKEDHPRVAANLNNVANSLDELGRFAEALPKHQAALAMRRRIYRGDDPDTAMILNSLAECLGHLGRLPEALTNHEEALAMRLRIYKGDHPSVARDLNNLASCLDALGRSTEALPKHEEALAMRQRIYKGDHPAVAISLNNLAICLGALGRSTEALTNFELTLAMRQRLYKGDHPAVAKGLNNVAYCLNQLGRSSEALPKYEAALMMWQRIHQKDHPDVASCLNSLASCLDSLGRLAEALPKHQRALEMWQRIHPADHPDVATGLNNLANCLVSLGGATDALPMLEAALAMRQRIYQREHPDLAASLHSLASCLGNLGRWAAAVTNQDAALAIWQRAYKGAHPTVAKALQDLGSFLVPLGRFDEANRRYQEALEMLERLSAAQPGNNSIKVRLAGTHQKIGDLLVQTAKPEEADKSYRKALEMAESVLALDAGNFQAEKLKLGCRVKLRLEEVEVVVSGVAPNGQAQEIGLHEGDVVFAYSGQKIVGTDQLTKLIGGTKGTRVELEVRRDGSPLKFTVREGPLGVRCEDRRIPN